ncbi:MAG: patatin-like phospholipase family protein [Actinobacteria bacterium]|nr:MAG: patatin-like phospholipase family protein [Actinomycetota bacterium]
MAIVEDGGMRIGLALGGGGLTGTAFHAGVLNALADHIDPRQADVIVGTSAGSTAAALMRSGFPATDYVARIAGRPMSAEGRAVLGGMPPLSDPGSAAPGQRRPASPQLVRSVLRRPWRFAPGVALSAFLPAGTRPVDAGAARFSMLFDQWPVQPTWIVAVALDTGERVVFGREASATVADAVSASCAVPGYFAPVEIAGRQYIDGGAHSMVSLDLLAGEGLDLVIVSAPLSTTDWVAGDPGNLPRVALRAQLQREARRLRGTRIITVAPDARMRRIMGTNSMVAAKRAPVADAALEYARSVFRRAL